MSATPGSDKNSRRQLIGALHRFAELDVARLRLLTTADRGPDANPEHGLSKPQIRILFAIAQHAPCNGATLVHLLNLDAGYVSRLLKQLRNRELLDCRSAANDARVRDYMLSASGKQAMAQLNATPSRRMEKLLAKFSPLDARELANALQTLHHALDGNSATDDAILLRDHVTGDMGWIVQRHAQIYSHEYGWNAQFEALCARIAAEFIENFDVASERCWIAERHGQRLGSALVANTGNDTAQIRLVLVEPQARGHGLGRRLIRECVEHASNKQYRRITLWTNENLHAARHIYASEGFERISSESHHSFGTIWSANNGNAGYATDLTRHTATSTASDARNPLHPLQPPTVDHDLNSHRRKP